jgi:aquaporin Z
MFRNKKVAMLLAELVGTAVLALVFVGVQHNGIGYPFFIALAAGSAVGAMALVFGSTSGAHFNPALTLGLWTARKVKTVPSILYIGVQILGGAIAFWTYNYLAKTHLQGMAGHYQARVMIGEAIGVFVFVVGWAAAAAQKFEGIRLAATVGGSFALGVIIASVASYGFANPAIAMADNSFGWSTYVLGPAIGGIVGVNFYNMLLAGTTKGKK